MLNLFFNQNFLKFQFRILFPSWFSQYREKWKALYDLKFMDSFKFQTTYQFYLLIIVHPFAAPAPKSQGMADCCSQRQLPGAGKTLYGPSQFGQVAGECGFPMRFYKHDLFAWRYGRNALSFVSCIAYSVSQNTPEALSIGRRWLPKLLAMVN